MLWIAFIFQYLWDTTQQAKTKTIAQQCCELLSFFSIFGIQHNTFRKKVNAFSVVNCFHFSVSLGYNTTTGNNDSSTTKLWIAFIFQYLCDTTQRLRYSDQRRACCELLSFFSIFGIQHNLICLHHQLQPVVNCFHFSVSLGYNTTRKTSTDPPL